ncbi:hypothetical protein PtB15_3B339 [Puccinia triticina]|nr:hypothetical protein PtB15_3B339 [Puccinia triticina]
MVRRQNQPTFVVQNINTTGTSRRSRTSTRQERNAPRERRERETIQRDIALARRLGLIENVAPPEIDPINSQHQFEPIIGSYDDQHFDEDVQALPSTAHASYHRARRYAEERKQLNQRWISLEKQAIAAYMLCFYNTRNWTEWSPTSSLFEFDQSLCSCSANQIHSRRVDLFDIVSREPSAEAKFCECTPDVIRLIYYGYLASSPTKPRTAFSIRLVQFYKLIWLSSVVSIAAFVKALSAFLDSRSNRPTYSRGGRYRKRILQVPFSHSVDLYSRIQANRKNLFDDGLQLTQNGKWAAKCPRCFGDKQHEVKGDSNEPDIIIALDGNFQQRHYAYASKDNPTETQYPPSFIAPSKISPDAVLFAATEAAAVGIDVSFGTSIFLNKSYYSIM